MPGSGDVLSPELRRPIRKIFTDTMISNDMERYAVGADIGGSHICSAVVDLTTGEICGEPLSGKVDCDAGAGEILGAWADNIRQSIAASGLKAVRRVGFAFPGPFDYEHGVSLIRGVNKFERIYGRHFGVAFSAAAAVRSRRVPLCQRRFGLCAGRVSRRRGVRCPARGGAHARNRRRVGFRIRP